VEEESGGGEKSRSIVIYIEEGKEEGKKRGKKRRGLLVILVLV